jgi:hypothetical protein
MSVCVCALSLFHSWVRNRGCVSEWVNIWFVWVGGVCVSVCACVLDFTVRYFFSRLCDVIMIQTSRRYSYVYDIRRIEKPKHHNTHKGLHRRRRRYCLSV